MSLGTFLLNVCVSSNLTSSLIHGLTANFKVATKTLRSFDNWLTILLQKGTHANWARYTITIFCLLRIFLAGLRPSIHGWRAWIGYPTHSIIHYWWSYCHLGLMLLSCNYLLLLLRVETSLFRHVKQATDTHISIILQWYRDSSGSTLIILELTWGSTVSAVHDMLELVLLLEEDIILLLVVHIRRTQMIGWVGKRLFHAALYWWWETILLLIAAIVS
jgi:hypothetical protein